MLHKTIDCKRSVDKTNGGMFSEIDKNGCWVLLVMMAQCAFFLKKEKQLTRLAHFYVSSIAMGLHCH
jgi:hypothetical protein